MAGWTNLDPTQRLEDSRGGRETRCAHTALLDYLQLGSDRSLAELLARYQAAGEGVPTRRAATLQMWAHRYNWTERADCYDQLNLECAQAGELERQKQIMFSGLALTSERVDNLKQLYAEMQKYFTQALPVWAADLRSEPGDSSNRAIRFNTSFISQMRGILDDIARETGGRAARNAPPAQGLPYPGAEDGFLPDLKLLSAEDLEALDRVLQKTAGACAGTAEGTTASRGQVWQPGLPGLIK
jgi:hypothetical protein